MNSWQDSKERPQRRLSKPMDSIQHKHCVLHGSRFESLELKQLFSFENSVLVFKKVRFSKYYELATFRIAGERDHGNSAV